MHIKGVGGHYATKNTVAKILNAGYWWPTMFKDVHEYIQRCDSCQRTGRPTPTTRWPLVPIMPLAPFKKWGIDFVAPIQLGTKHTQRRYILVATDYATRIIEAEATRRDDAATISKFLFKAIVTRYGCPLELVSDRGTYFLNSVIEDLTSHFQIKHRKTTPYNPKANGLTEKSNGLLCKILLKVTHPILPIEFKVPTHWVLDCQRLGNDESQLYRLKEVLSLEERREVAKQQTEQIQLKRKKAYDKRVRPVTLLKEDLALLYDSRHARFP
ncbi:hypothetical protein AXG93_80s1010 [Marchantia polymorpha subsp. ruderalis]|uniref:Integrase catalytic domain-containing protein n=1 Tax=Marchantia polymorpha subsp. ruderalis TaxID=1480154 RepID=A0A176W1N7_MARPO|nr:hypothetical protein AXG93_80s1010 [Marchantia polymorpha subsp. ruderalis]